MPYLRDVLELRVVGLRHHEAKELDGRVQVCLVSVPVAGHVALDRSDRLFLFFFIFFGVEFRGTHSIGAHCLWYGISLLKCLGPGVESN